MIRLSKSIVGEKEIEALTAVMKKGYLGMGAETQAFENELAEYIGGGVTVVCVNTGTSALHLAVQALGIGPGDEVLIPSLTFVASFQAVSATGATPVACDVLESSGLLDLKDAEKRVSPRTKAVMPVHYASAVGDLEALYAFAKKHRLRVIEDAAHAFGCSLNGKKIGSFGDVVCFSFDGIKNITSGEGGAVVTKDAAVAARVQDARLLGVEKDTEKRYAGHRSWEFDVKEQGWRYHMSDLMAGIGRAQLRRLEPEFKPRRIALAKIYREKLSKLPGVALFEQGPGEIVPHILPIKILGSKRDEVRNALLAKDIQVGIHYKPNHLLTRYKTSYPLPAAEKIYSGFLTLPLHPEVRESDIDQIVDVIRGACG